MASNGVWLLKGLVSVRCMSPSDKEILILGFSWAHHVVYQKLPRPRHTRHPGPILRLPPLILLIQIRLHANSPQLHTKTTIMRRRAVRILRNLGVDDALEALGLIGAAAAAATASFTHISVGGGGGVVGFRGGGACFAEEGFR